MGEWRKEAVINVYRSSICYLAQVIWYGFCSATLFLAEFAKFRHKNDYSNPIAGLHVYFIEIVHEVEVEARVLKRKILSFRIDFLFMIIIKFGMTSALHIQ